MPLKQTSLVVLADSFAPQGYTADALREVLGPEASDLIATPLISQIESETGLKLTVEMNKLTIAVELKDDRTPPSAFEQTYSILDYIMNSNRLIKRQALGINFIGYENIDVPEAQAGAALLQWDFLEQATEASITDASFTLKYNKEDQACRLTVRPSLAMDSHLALAADLNVHHPVSDLGQLLQYAKSQAHWYEYFATVLDRLSQKVRGQ